MAQPKQKDPDPNYGGPDRRFYRQPEKKVPIVGILIASALFMALVFFLSGFFQ